MKNKSETPYFFDKNKSEFCKKDFDIVMPKKFHFGEKLTKDLQNNLFVYESKNNNSIFYFVNHLITSKEELAELHLRILSEDKADFYAIKSEKDKNTGIELIFAKTTVENKKTIIYIPENTKDEELLKTINKTSIDTGTFWIYYKDVLSDAKITNIRDRLVEILSELRDKLKQEIGDDKYIQTLIDRTLFIKFLEDRHIINSYFYGEDIEYKNVLKSQSPKKLNDLFAKIQEIFNNYLFLKPEIKLPEKFLTKPVFKILQNTIEGSKNNQLTLFDYKFDIIPIEAISLIYEIFLDEIQRKDGIYYTPKELTNLITEKTIDKKGKIIDFACGSGSFLISAYKRLLQLDQKQFVSIKEKINYRIKLIKDNIFGIEKEKTARRLSVFSMYLSILDDLSPKDNEDLKELLKNEKNYPLFIEDIGDNIIHSNTFEKNKFDSTQFDFIIGNPPWKKDFEDEHAIKYYNENKSFFSGKRELSELFLHKAKTWEKKNTRYGFVVNTSNFINEYTKFQDFFYKNFNIEKFYEVTDLEFFTASEPAIVCIYTGNKQENNILTLNILKANDFTKLFKSVFILDEDNIKIKQDDLIETKNQKNIPLRNYLAGGDGDFTIINYLESNRFEKFEKFVLKNEKGEPFIHQGVKVYSKKHLEKIYQIDTARFSEEEISNYRKNFYDKYTSNIKTNEFCFPYIKTKNISRFNINNSEIELYLPYDISNLERSRSSEILENDRILISRTSNVLKAVYIDSNRDRIYPTAHINTIKLNNQDYLFYTAILNSKLVEYFLKIMFWQRQKSGFPRINQDPILQIPIPIIKNSEIVKQIENLSKQFTNGDIEFKTKEEEFNELIYDLFGIGIVERQRVNDFFIKDGEKVKQDDLKKYSQEFCEYLIDDLKHDVNIVTEEFTEQNLVKGISIVKIYFGKKGEKYPKAEKVGKYLLTDLLKNATKENILTLRNRIYGENTIYIIKDNLKKSWSLTKAGEDAIAELNKINKHNSTN
jgi:type I restriction-modification system DNA methylase subunit